MRSTFMQADRSVVELEADGYEVADPWDSYIRITMPLDGRSPDAKRTRQLHIAHRGNYDYVIEVLQRGAIYHRLTAQDGEFLVSASRDPGTQGVALWRGPYHEIATFVPHSRLLDAALAMRPLMGLTFEDSPEGLRVIPQPVLNATLSVTESSTYVRGIGTITMRSAAEGMAAVPAWAGAKVPAGELWKVEVVEQGDNETVRYLQLATRSAVMLIAPDANAIKSSQPFAPALDFAYAVRRAAVS